MIRMSGGGKNKKKMKKVVEASEQSATDKKSTETDVVIEVDRCSQTGVGGWSAEMMVAMSEMDDEQTERMLGRSILPKVDGDEGGRFQEGCGG